MKLHPLGELRRDPDIEEWFNSACVPVPYLGGDEIAFVVEGIEDDPAPHEFTDAISRFLSLSEADRQVAAPFAFEMYRRLVDMVGEDEFDFTINAPTEVWSHVDITAVHVVRRPYADKKVYIQMTGNCGWEQEHGFQIVLRQGHELARVSAQDGHLTTADAYALPEDQDTIIHKG